MAIELWVHDALDAPQQVQKLWYFTEPVDPNPSEPVEIQEMWVHDGVDFKQVFTTGATNPGFVTPTGITHSPVQVSTFNGIKTSNLVVTGSGHFDGGNPNGATTTGHSTSFTHVADWFSPNAAGTGDSYYALVTNLVLTGPSGVMSEVTSGTSLLTVNVKDGPNLATSNWSGTQMDLTSGDTTSNGGNYPIGSVPEYMSAQVIFQAYYNGESTFSRTATFDLSIHRKSDDGVEVTWPVTLSINLTSNAGGE
jgi:hypothetical protein